MVQKIIAVKEAFSIMPETWKLCDTPLSFHEHSSKCIKEIKKIQTGPYSSIYAAFNFDGNKIIEFQEESVNIFYEES